MLKNHANVGIECGIPKENTFVLQNGDVLSLKNHQITKTTPIIANDIYVDGNRLGEINGAVLRDRKIMASDGILVVIANVDFKNKELLIKPNITTRGFIQINENEAVIRKLECLAANAINEKLKANTSNFNDIKTQVTSDLFNYVYETTGRKPIILPVILDVKKTTN